ncbi:type-2 ice-structuring protein-like [Festucalex cinctus]
MSDTFNIPELTYKRTARRHLPHILSASSITTPKMAFALRSLLLLCGISGLLTGVWSSDVTVKVPCCSEGWTRLNDRCFYVVDQLRDFQDAEDTCEALGGNLASILSAVEHAVVLALVDAEVGDDQIAWIGYNDRAVSGTYVWTDGSSTAGNPVFFETGGTTPEDCTVTNDGTDTEFWDDEDCTSTVPFVCVDDVH